MHCFLLTQLHKWVHLTSFSRTSLGGCDGRMQDGVAVEHGRPGGDNLVNLVMERLCGSTHDRRKYCATLCPTQNTLETVW